jgi:phosphoglycerol transferase MdoB-like AlkP superfamily enzyme
MRNRWAVITRLFAMMLLVYAMLRLAFLLIYFPNENWSLLKLLKLFYWGCRLDFSALFYINTPFLIYYFFIDVFLQFEWKRKVSLVFFLVINLPFLAINFIDLVYYRYNHRRSTVDLLEVFSDSSSAFGSFFKEYWYVLIIFLLVCISLARRSLRMLSKTSNRNSTLAAYVLFSLVFLTAMALVARGFTKRPIQPAAPLLYFESRYQPLVNNSTFNFLYSVVKKQTAVEQKNYFTGQQLDSLYLLRQQYQHDSAFTKRNVVICVLESFSKTLFTDPMYGASMPFFDSLMQHSTVCNNAFASAYESNKGLSAILGSFPDVMDEPIYLSNYNSIPFSGLGHLLKKEGYNTSFFMGAEYDHFGFAKLCKMVGIDEYYSKDTYGKHPGHDDGNWGVYDEYFFDYFAGTISKKRQPFFSVLFNLSSHPPYKIPEATAGKIKVPGQWPYQDAATYVDYCFRQLFNKISKEPWFQNTLFVFVADHGYRYVLESNQALKEMRIPLFIYDPQQPEYGAIDGVVKQLDVIPSVLDKLNYSKPFTSFGSSVFRQPGGFSVSRMNATYQLVDSATFLGYDELNDRPVFLYHYREDSMLVHNLLPGNTAEAENKAIRIKALLQRIHNGLINNKLD